MNGQRRMVYNIREYYYPAIKKDEILPFTTWIDLEGIMVNEISYIEKNKYCIISLMWNYNK